MAQPHAVMVEELPPGWPAELDPPSTHLDVESVLLPHEAIPEVLAPSRAAELDPAYASARQCELVPRPVQTLATEAVSLPHAAFAEELPPIHASNNNQQHGRSSQIQAIEAALSHQAQFPPHQGDWWMDDEDDLHAHLYQARFPPDQADGSSMDDDEDDLFAND